MADSAWIAQMVEHGLVRPSFVPPPPIRALRDLTRHRRTLVEERTRVVQRLEKVMQDASAYGASADGPACLIYDLSPARFDIENSLPSHISDLAWMAAAYALWSRRQWFYALTYYWGLTLVPQALITPALDARQIPSIDFFSFWGQHLLVVWAAVYLTWWVGMRPSWRSFAFAATVTVVWGIAMLGFNKVAGTNYLFVNSRPDNPSLLDFMGNGPGTWPSNSSSDWPAGPC